MYSYVVVVFQNGLQQLMANFLFICFWFSILLTVLSNIIIVPYFVYKLWHDRDKNKIIILDQGQLPPNPGISTVESRILKPSFFQISR